MEMQDGVHERRSEGRRRRRWLKRLAIGIPLVAVLYIVGSFLYVGFVVYNPHRVARHAYDSWLRDKREAHGSFRELAREKGWKMYVWANNSIGLLDLGSSTLKPLYTPRGRRRIYKASSSRGGRVAFTDCMEKSGLFRVTVDRSDFELGILGVDGSLTKVPLGGTIRSLWLGPMALSENSAFFGCGSGAYLYEIEAKRLHAAFEPPPDWQDDHVVKVALAEGKFLALLMENLRVRRLVVLESEKPFRLLSKMDGVSNVLTVGENIVIEKGEGGSGSDSFIGEYVATWGEGACLLYEPANGTTEHLTAGHLVCSCGDDEFIFCTLNQGNTSQGRGPLHRYRIRSRSQELLWAPLTGKNGSGMGAGQERQYDYTRLFLSLDSRFLFIPWHLPPRSHAELHLARMLEYEVYDLTTGEKRGAFVDSFQGKLSFGYLGWVENGGAQ